MPYLGELAALATAFFWTIGPIYFTLAGRQVGSVVVNRSRLALAGVYLLVAHWLIYGQPLPFDAAPDRWFWLSLSGLIGFVLGDAALFQAFLTIGTRLTMVIFAINPIIGALLAWLFLGENLTGLEIAGMLITLAGVAWVVSERSNNNEQNQLSPKEYAAGIGLGVLAAAGQAGGFVAAKLGLYGDFPALSGQIIRVISATVIIWAMALFSRKAKETVQSLRENKQAFNYILIASLLGPFFGVFFSLVAVQNTDVGIASTFMALPPVLLIPIDRFFFKEKVTWRAVIGTVVALVGVAVLFLV